MEPENIRETERLSAEIRLLAAVGYLPMLFFLPLLIRPRERFCYFHGIQSLLLLTAFAIFWIGVFIVDLLFSKILGNVIIFGLVFRITAWIIHYLGGTSISILYLILIIYCFIQSAAGQMWPIPVIGSYARRIAVSQNR
jgi:uncharacterized membrane protein